MRASWGDGVRYPRLPVGQLRRSRWLLAGLTVVVSTVVGVVVGFFAGIALAIPIVVVTLVVLGVLARSTLREFE